MGGCSHVDAMRAAEEEFEPTETSRDEADEARPETVIKGIGPDSSAEGSGAGSWASGAGVPGGEPEVLVQCLTQAEVAPNQGEAHTQCIERRGDVDPLVQNMSAGCSLRESD